MNKEALIVIDVQTAVMEHSYNRETIMDTVNSLISAARKQKIPFIFVQHEFPEGPMKRGGDGWKLDPRLEQPLSDESIIYKTLPNAFADTTLKETLDQIGATHLYICGAQTDFCVDSSCRGAFDLHYDVTLITDAHTTTDNAHLTAPQIIEHIHDTLGNFWSPNSTMKMEASKDLHWMKSQIQT